MFFEHTFAFLQEKYQVKTNELKTKMNKMFAENMKLQQDLIKKVLDQKYLKHFTSEL